MNGKEIFKVLSLIGCMLLIFNCNTAPPQQFQENKKDQIFLIINGSDGTNAKNLDINELQSLYINIDENIFINILNKNLDKLSRLEGVWSNNKNTYKIGIQKAKEKGRYLAFILNSQEPNIKKGEIVAEFYETRYDDVYFTEYYLENKKKIETKSYISGQSKLQLTIFLTKLDKENVFFLKQYPDIIYH
jgi:hypothetical protein